MKKQSKGFTLIELLIVVTIIGIMAAIAIPKIQTYLGTNEKPTATYSSGSIAPPENFRLDHAEVQRTDGNPFVN